MASICKKLVLYCFTFLFLIGLVVSSGLLPDEWWTRMPAFVRGILIGAGAITATVTVGSAFVLIRDMKWKKRETSNRHD